MSKEANESGGSDAPRVLVVTGASRGIGAEVARLAGRRGYRVCVNYASRADAADAVVAEINGRGGEAFGCRADVASEDDARRLFAETDRRFGQVTDLVNNAGVFGGTTTVAELDYEVLRRLFEVNVLGCFLCCREAIRRMSFDYGGSGGRIVNVSSVAAINGSAGERVHYAASKGAVNAMGIGLGREVARQGIRVNTFSPGVTRTDLHPPGRIEKVVGRIPLGRAAEPEEMARAILWLLSDEAAYCTASNLVMSGGR